ncbi:MAG: hypothetical protein ABW145_15640, partial [Candidatus Thiodiazotropha sp.]
MTSYRNHLSILGLCLLAVMSIKSAIGTEAQDGNECFESRDGMSQVISHETAPGMMNVKCSPATGGVLWWGDPFEGTIPMGHMDIEADYFHEEAVVKPREPQIDR